MVTTKTPSFVLRLACQDRRGIVREVSGFLSDRGCNINEAAQFQDPQISRFFMRIAFSAEAQCVSLTELRTEFEVIANEFEMDWEMREAGARMPALIMVSKLGHCLHDLLLRWRSGLLPIDVKAIVSNHRDFCQLAASYDVPFHHIPVTPDSKSAAEDHLLSIIDAEQVELVILARYMQVLSDGLSRRLHGQVINIHHSFLPGFKGAKPYDQAFQRGVKLIGATAHYVSADLDEGPIIEQEVERADHAMSPVALTNLGRDVESVVLARAVRWHAEHRLVINGSRTVVFR